MEFFYVYTIPTQCYRREKYRYRTRYEVKRGRIISSKGLLQDQIQRNQRGGLFLIVDDIRSLIKRIQHFEDVGGTEFSGSHAALHVGIREKERKFYKALRKRDGHESITPRCTLLRDTCAKRSALCRRCQLM